MSLCLLIHSIEGSVQSYMQPNFFDCWLILSCFLFNQHSTFACFMTISAQLYFFNKESFLHFLLSSFYLYPSVSSLKISLELIHCCDVLFQSNQRCEKEQDSRLSTGNLVFQARGYFLVDPFFFFFPQEIPTNHYKEINPKGTQPLKKKLGKQIAGEIIQSTCSFLLDLSYMLSWNTFP